MCYASLRARACGLRRPGRKDDGGSHEIVCSMLQAAAAAAHVDSDVQKPCPLHGIDVTVISMPVGCRKCSTGVRPGIHLLHR